MTDAVGTPVTGTAESDGCGLQTRVTTAGQVQRHETHALEVRTVRHAATLCCPHAHTQHYSQWHVIYAYKYHTENYFTI